MRDNLWAIVITALIFLVLVPACGCLAAGLLAVMLFVFCLADGGEDA